MPGKSCVYGWWHCFFLILWLQIVWNVVNCSWISFDRSVISPVAGQVLSQKFPIRKLVKVSIVHARTHAWRLRRVSHFLFLWESEMLHRIRVSHLPFSEILRESQRNKKCETCLCRTIDCRRQCTVTGMIPFLCWDTNHWTVPELYENPAAS